MPHVPVRHSLSVQLPAVVLMVALLLMAALRGLEAAAGEGGTFDLAGSLAALLYPDRTAEVLSLFGALVFGMICGLFTAAVFAARRGASAEPPPTDTERSP